MNFIEQPPQDFFCPVTLELLVQPHQTTCCGNHLSQEAAERLKKDGKPCPMCKEPQLGTMPDKYMKRKVNNVRVRCSYKGSGCEWEGEVSNLRSHVDSCPKRPWHCEHCDYESTHEIGTSEHVPTCLKYLIVCPNSCEVGSVPRGEVEEHLTVCPLQIVDCQYAEVGCDVKVPRKELACHLDDAQQQHLLSATLLNVQLTRENLAEKDRIIAENDRSIAEKDRIIAEKDRIIAEKDQIIAEKDKSIAEKDAQHKENDFHIQEQLKGLDTKVTALQECMGNLNMKPSAFNSYYTSQGYTAHNIEVKRSDYEGNSYRDSFYSHPGSYKFGLRFPRSSYLSVELGLFQGDYDSKLDWPVKCSVHILLLNQIGDYDHQKASQSLEFSQSDYNYKEAFPKLIAKSELGFNAEKNTQYLKDDRLKLQVYIKCEKAG